MDHAKRVDRCILHALKSIAVGTAVGLLASTLIFKRKKWAFIMGVGYGAGSAIAGCDFELLHKEYLEPCEEAKKKQDAKDKSKKKSEESEPAAELSSKDKGKKAGTLDNKKGKTPKKADEGKQAKEAEEKKEKDKE